MSIVLWCHPRYIVRILNKDNWPVGDNRYYFTVFEKFLSTNHLYSGDFWWQTMSSSVTGHPSQVDADGGSRCDVPLKRARTEHDSEQPEGRRRAG